MRNFSLFLVFLLSLVFMVSCGSDSKEDPTGYTCAPANPTGTCEAGKTCQNGICVTQNQYTCSATNPTGTCEAGKVCQNGTCITTSNACSATNPNGTCDAGKVCQNGTCVVQNNACSATNPTGTCEAGKTCQGGVCVTTNNACSATNPTGTCEAGKTCQGGVCVTIQTNGTVGSACSANTDCVGTDAQCVTELTGGYCTAPCATNGGTCLTNGYCLVNGENSFCYKTCTFGNDSTCGRADYVCEDYSDTEPICVPKCTSAADCNEAGSSTYECKADGHCGLPAAVCDIVTSDGCSAGKACYPQQDGTLICYQAGTSGEGAACEYLNDCQVGLICLNDGVCHTLCNDANPCNTGRCGIFQDETFGYCLPAGTTPIGGNCANEDCIATAACLTDPNTNASICYEICDPNTGGACSQNGYTCQAIGSGETFCFEPAGK